MTNIPVKMFSVLRSGCSVSSHLVLMWIEKVSPLTSVALSYVDCIQACSFICGDFLLLRFHLCLSLDK